MIPMGSFSTVLCDKPTARLNITLQRYRIRVGDITDTPLECDGGYGFICDVSACAVSDPGGTLKGVSISVDRTVFFSYKRRLRCYGADFAQVAQLVERGTENPCVGGSIPPLGTTFFCSWL